MVKVHCTGRASCRDVQKVNHYPTHKIVLATSLDFYGWNFFCWPTTLIHFVLPYWPVLPAPEGHTWSWTSKDKTRTLYQHFVFKLLENATSMWGGRTWAERCVPLSLAMGLYQGLPGPGITRTNIRNRVLTTESQMPLEGSSAADHIKFNSSSPGPSSYLASSYFLHLSNS